MDLSSLKLSAQKYSKCDSAAEKRALGQEAVGAALLVCHGLSVSWPRGSTPSSTTNNKTSPTEAACKALSYVLANAGGMHESAQPQLLAAFATTLASQLQLAGEGYSPLSEAEGGERNRNSASSGTETETEVERRLRSAGQWESLGKCATHLAQAAAAAAAKCGAACSAPGRPASSSSSKAASTQQQYQHLLHTLNVVLSPAALLLLQRALSTTHGAEQAGALLNYLADTSFALCAALDGLPLLLRSGSSSSSVSSTSGAGAGAARGGALALARNAVDAQAATTPLLGSSRCALELGMDKDRGPGVAAVLRYQALQLVTTNNTSFRMGRVLEVHCRLLLSHTKAIAAGGSASSVQQQQQAKEAGHKGRQLAALLGPVLLRWVRRVRAMKVPPGQGPHAGAAAAATATSVDVLRAILYLRQQAVSASDIEGGPSAAVLESMPGLVSHCVRIATAAGFSSHTHQDSWAQWETLCSYLCLSSSSSSSGEGTIDAATAAALCGSPAILGFGGSAGPDAAAALLTGTLRSATANSRRRGAGTDTSVACLQSFLAAAGRMRGAVEAGEAEARAATDCSRGSQESKAGPAPSPRARAAVAQASAALRAFVCSCVEGLATLGSDCKAKACQAAAAGNAAGGGEGGNALPVQAAVGALQFAAVALQALATPHLFPQGDPGTGIVLRAAGACLAQVPLPLFQEACREDSMVAAAAAIDNGSFKTVGRRLLHSVERCVKHCRSWSSSSSALSGQDTPTDLHLHEELLTSLVTMLSTRCSMSMPLPTIANAAATSDGSGSGEQERVTEVEAELEIVLGVCPLLLCALTSFPSSSSSLRFQSALAVHSSQVLYLCNGNALWAQRLWDVYEPALSSSRSNSSSSSSKSPLECQARASTHTKHTLAVVHAAELAARAAQMVRSPAVMDACMTFIADVTNAAELPAVLVEAQQLYVSSHFCWAAQLGPGGELGASIVARIKAVCVLLDTAGQPTIQAVAKARGRVTRKTKSSTAATPAPATPAASASSVATATVTATATTEVNPQIARSLSSALQTHPGLDSVLCVRMWLLLCRWSEPTTTAAEDRKASDGKIGSAVYLTNSLCALRASVHAVEKNAKSASTASSADADADAEAEAVDWGVYSRMLAVDTQSLYFSLGLFGRSQDQADAVGLLRKLLSFSSSSQQQGQGQPSGSGSSICTELEILQLVQAVWSGGKYKHEAEVDLCSSSPWVLSAHAVLSIACSTLSSTSIDADTDNKVTNPKSTTPTVPTVAVLCEATETAWSAAGRAARTTAAIGYASRTPAAMQAVRAWLALLCAKACSYVHCDRKSSLYWARKALGATVQAATATATTSSSDANPNPGSSTSLGLGVETSLPRLEAALLISEDLEQVGDVDAALSYAGEALALSSIGSQALSSIVALHTLRLWHRTGSHRLVTVVGDSLYSHTDKKSAMQEIRNDVSPQCRGLIGHLARLLGIPVESASASYSNSAVNAADAEDGYSTPTAVASLLQYRHINRMWNVPALVHRYQEANQGSSSNGDGHGGDNGSGDSSGKGSIGSGLFSTVFEIVADPIDPDAEADEYGYGRSSSRNDFHGSMPGALRAGTNALLLDIPSASTTAATASTAAELLAMAQSCGSFDVVRSLRRRACVHSTTVCGGTGVTTALSAFVLGSSSCGATFECSIDVHACTQSSSKSSSKSTSASASASASTSDKCNPRNFKAEVSHLVGKACTGDEASLRVIRECCDNTIQSIDTATSSASSSSSSSNGSRSNGAILLFAALDRESGDLLLGRMQREAPGSGTVVARLPIGKQVTQLLAEWETISSQAKMNLQSTMDPVKVATWTDAEKRQWWKQRESFDTSISTTLRKLESLLGPWRALFAPLLSTSMEAKTLRQRQIEVKAAQAEPHKDAYLVECTGSMLDLSHLSAAEISSAESTIKIFASAFLSSKASNSSNSSTYTYTYTREDAFAGVQAVIRSLLPKSSKKLPYATDAALDAQLAVLSFEGDGDVSVNASASVNATRDSSNANTNADSDVDSLCAGLKQLKVAELRQRLKHGGLPTDGTKAELLGRLETSVSEAHAQIGGGGSGKESAKSRSAVDAVASAHASGKGHIVLILDENLQGLPWECMPCLRRHDCSRVPGLALLLGLGLSIYTPEPKKWLQQQQQINEQPLCTGSDKGAGTGAMQPRSLSPVRHQYNPACSRGGSRSPKRDRNNNKYLQPSGVAGVSLKSSWYVVDPENNLPNTQKTMHGFLAPYGDKYMWNGYIGEIPPESCVRSRHDDASLFIFCGHGAGEKVCDVRKLRKCYCPAALLWGCSSGHLPVRGVHDPAGAALQYLINGSPFVVANLWDVTDRDIDRLSVECMQQVFSAAESIGADDTKRRVLSLTPSPTSASASAGLELTLAGALMDARAVCKMGHAVGAAPVVYGLPASTVL